MRTWMLQIRGGVERDSKGRKAGKGALIKEDHSPCLGTSLDSVLITKEMEMKNETNENSSKVLLRVWAKVGAEAFRKWTLGRFQRFLEEEVLRHEMHGEGVLNEASQGKPRVDDRSLPCEEIEAENVLRDMWLNAKFGHPSCGHELAEQLAEQLAMLMQKLSSKSSQKDEGAMSYIVRRLTPTETERLMGYPDGYTVPQFKEITDELVEEFVKIHNDFNALMSDKPVKPKTAKQVRKWLETISNPETCSDAPRYKVCGNGWAINCARWVLQGVDRFLHNLK